MNRLLFITAANLILLGHLIGMGWLDPQRDPLLMVAGTAARPFVYRQLLPTLVRVFATPAQWQTAIMLLVIVAFWSWLAAWWYLFTTFAPMTGRAWWAALAGLPILMAMQSHLYDLPTLALTTLCYAALARGRWLLLGVAFAALALNRETALLVALLVAVSFPRKWYVWLPLFALWGGARWVVVQAYGGNPGGDLEFHLIENLTHWALDTWTSIPYAMLGILLARAVWAQWRHTPALVRRGLVVVGAPLLALFVVFGFTYELRVFYEVLPLILVCLFKPHSVV